MLLAAIIITLAIRYFWEKGKREYAHTRDTHAAELSRTHRDWSPRKIQRHARRRARGYWWDQIRRGFPDLKAAYEEDRLIAEAERAKAVLEGEKRRKELRDRIREAIEEHHRLREEERQAEDARRAQTGPETTSGPKPDREPSAAASAKPSPGHADEARSGETDRASTSNIGGRCSICGNRADRLQTRHDPRYVLQICPRCIAPYDAGERPPTDSPAPDAAPSRPRLRPVPDQPAATDPTTTEGEPMDNSGMGDAHGYEQILAAYNADVERRTAEVESTQAHVADLEAADAAYERQMAMLRSANADDATIEQVAALREANEQQIASARDLATAAHDGLTRAVAARDDWVGRHGAVHEAKASTGARGDEVLYTT